MQSVAVWTPGFREVASRTPVCSSARQRAASVPKDIQKDECVHNVIPEGIDPRSFRQWAFGVAKALRSLESSVDSIRKRLDAVEGVSTGPSHPKTKAYKYNARADGSEKTWTPTLDLSRTKLMVDRAVSDPEPRMGRSSASTLKWVGTDHTTLRRQWKLDGAALTPRESDTSPYRQRLAEAKRKAIPSVPKIQAISRGAMQTDVRSQIVQTPLSKEARFNSTALKTPRTGGPTTPRRQKTYSEKYDIWCEVSRHDADPELQVAPHSPLRRSVTPDKTPRGDSSELVDADDDGLSPAILFEASSEASHDDDMEIESPCDSLSAEAQPKNLPLSAQEKRTCCSIEEEPTSTEAQTSSVPEDATNDSQVSENVHAREDDSDSQEVFSSMPLVQIPEPRHGQEKTAAVDSKSEEIRTSADRQQALADGNQSEAVIDDQASEAETSEEMKLVREIQSTPTQEQGTNWECSPGGAFSPLQPTVMPGMPFVDVTAIKPIDLQSEEAGERLENVQTGTDNSH